jgi:peptidoglycan/LPS O-acetylase OafA/YrhL
MTLTTHLANPFTKFKRLLLFLLPSYLASNHDFTAQTTSPLRATSALDGIRGLAALIVFIFHILFAYTPLVEYGYGLDFANNRLIQLPFLRILYAGHAMVAVFFVVGGYVMAIKPLTLIHARKWDAVFESLVSSTFRRGIRIYGPAVLATFVTMLTIWLGLWEDPRRFITDTKAHVKFIFFSDYHPERQSSLSAQLWDWLIAAKGLTNVFTYYNGHDGLGFLMPYYNQYDPHLWTVPFEYRSSMIVALVLLAVSRCRKGWRHGFMLWAIVFCVVWDRWEVVCFLAGALLCDFDIGSHVLDANESANPDETVFELEEDEEKLPEHETMPFLGWTSSTRLLSKSLRQNFNFVLFAFSIYLLSCPNLSIAQTPFYSWLSFITPTSYTDPKRLPHTLGAILVTYSVIRSPNLQKPFNSAAAQYLGRISYSLYIVHGPLIHIVGYSVTPNVWLALGVNNARNEKGVGVEGQGVEGFRWWLGLGISSLVLGMAVAVAADLFFRVVDKRCVRFARWVERLCFVS